MKTSTKIWIAAATLVAIFGFGGCSAAFSYRADCVNYESIIPAQYKQNKNRYDNNWKMFREMAQVPQQYVKDMKALWTDTMEGRYGPDGSKALFQFIAEHNPQLSPEVYTKLQTAIEAGRNSFAGDQKQLLDMKASYERVFKGNRALLVGWLFPYPTINLDEYDIVTSDRTEEVFRTGKSDEIDIFGNSQK